ncbi:MAG: hypothetical protein C0490_15025, partial [Marivirga sp.]|nr:hypothetical protein [Marivirga sp.]
MEKLLARLKAIQAIITIDNSDLRLEFPNGIDITDILDEIKANKKEIIHFISERNGFSDLAFINKTSNKSYYALSSAQNRMYFLHEFDKLSLAYNMPQAVKLD